MPPRQRLKWLFWTTCSLLDFIFLIFIFRIYICSPTPITILLLLFLTSCQGKVGFSKSLHHSYCWCIATWPWSLLKGLERKQKQTLQGSLPYPPAQKCCIPSPVAKERCFCPSFLEWHWPQIKSQRWKREKMGNIFHWCFCSDFILNNSHAIFFKLQSPQVFMFFSIFLV